MTDLWLGLLACCCLMWGAVALSPPIRKPAPATTLSSSNPPPTTLPPTPDLTYWVTFSTTVRAGSNQAVRVCMSSATGPVTLRLDLMDYYGKYMQDGQNFTLNATGDVQTVNFQISSDLQRQWSMYLRARASGGLVFDGFQRVYWDDKRLSVFIQTDKAIYKPGQTVRFRALVMQPDTKVADEPMDIVIMDPKKNLITQWKGVKGNDSGVFQGEMVTSDYPPLGNWKIKATVDGQSEEKNFELKEYELPRFEVTLTLPSYALVTDEKVVAKVSAKYTFGLPMQGSGSVDVKLSNWKPVPVSIVKTFTLGENGEAEVPFNNTELHNMGFKTVSYGSSYYKVQYFRIYYYTFQFTAEVKDSLTDDVMKSSSVSVRFHRSPLKMMFSKHTPSSFKSGLMPYTAYLEATQPDGQPLVNPKNVSVNFTVTYWRRWRPGDEYTTSSYRRYPPYSIRVVLLTEVVQLDSNGMAELKINSVPENVTRLIVRASAGDANAYKYLSSFTSPAKVFLQLKLNTKAVKVNHRLTIQLRSNSKFGNFTLQVYSKGELVLTRKEIRTGVHCKRTVSFWLTSAMTPVADVIVFFEAKGGEVVVDRLVLGVQEYSGNNVRLEFVKKEVKPGQTAKLKAWAFAGSTLFLLGVDKSVKLLGTGNDITKEDIMSELLAYGNRNIYWLRGSWYYYDYVSDADDVLRGARAGMITDGVIPGRYMNDLPQPFQKRKTYSSRFMAPAATVAQPASEVVMATESASSAGADKTTTRKRKEQTPAERLRKFFPETWLWDTIKMRGKLLEILPLKAPDTITSWEVSAFAVHPRLGLTVAKVPARLVTIKRLFVTLDLPYSAIRGEDVCFKALTFNRYPMPVKVIIVLAKNSSAFHNILMRKNRKNPGQLIEIRKTFFARKKLGLLKPNAIVSTTFCVNPRTLGDMPVQVFLRAKWPSDGLVRTIKIKPEGVERSQSYPVLIEITPTEQFSDTVKIDLPDKLVPGSLRMYVTLVGDVLGLVADNLEDLLRMPTGCGEQNMIHFAPNTYLIDYLRKTGRLTPAILTKAKNFMVAGYQRQLNYQHSDGSFSAFGDRDPFGSMWLTAFVTKCFVQAVALGSDVITIESNVISRAIKWMIQYQFSNGTFGEPGRVFHRAMQGGSASGLALTAYVTITLLEANNTVHHNLSTELSSALKLSVGYLESQLPSATNKTWGKNDSYTACILAYALTLAHSFKADEAVSVMNDLAETADTLKYWSGPVEIKQTYYSWYKKTDALSIEMTSYALLTLMLRGNVNNAIPPFRWLNKQRGDKGGFTSTQDTVLGLEALAAMSGLALGENFSPIQITITWNSGGAQNRSVTINKDNVMLLQKMDIPLQNDQYPDQITISATSAVSGNDSVFALTEVVAYYNVDNRTSPQVFSINTTISNSTSRSFVLKTCVNVEAETAQPDSMTVVEIGVPSGYRVVSSPSHFGNLQRKDISEDKVVLYYYSLDSEGECSILKMKMSDGMVANIKPVFTRVYDYYHTNNEFTTFYSLARYGVCEYMTCPVV